MKFAISAIAFATLAVVDAKRGHRNRFCRPDNRCWPREKDWNKLQRKLDEGILHKINTDAILKECLPGQNAINGSAISLDGNGACMQFQNCQYEECNPESHVLDAPAYSVEAKSVEDVQEALKFAKRHNLEVSIKSSGHSYGGSSTAKDSLMIWLRNFDKDLRVSHGYTDSCGTSYDDSVSISAGVPWAEMYETLGADYNIVGGQCDSVCASGGYVQGGGLSKLGRNYGLGVDQVISFEMVDANGKVLQVDRCENEDLFWALRGNGGGSLGVVTNIQYKLHPKTDFHVFGIIILPTVNGQPNPLYDDMVKRLLQFVVEEPP